MKNKQMINIPTLFTSLNLFCGFLSVVLATSGNYLNAAWLFFIAGIFDALDGRIARAFGRSSEFGLQMDSLCDVVSSGLAPALLAYEFHLKNLGHIGIILSFSPLLFGALRLARFNVYTAKTGKKPDFIGLPAPMAAVCISSLIIFYYATQWHILLRFLIVLVPLVSLLMISTMRYEGYPRFSLKERGANRLKLILFFITVTTFAIIPQYFLFPFMMVYLLYGPVVALKAIARNEETDIAIIAEEDKDYHTETEK